jgi:hypothetical protein
MHRWQPSVLVLVLFTGSAHQTQANSLTLTTGQAFTCSTTATMTTFTAAGVRSSDSLSESTFLFKILDSAVEETIVGRDVSEQLRKPFRFPISSRENGSLFASYSNGRSASDRHSVVFHLLNDKTAVYSDTAPGYSNAGGGVTIYAGSGLCQKVSK